jgi:hypothetical protein
MANSKKVASTIATPTPLKKKTWKSLGQIKIEMTSEKGYRFEVKPIKDSSQEGFTVFFYEGRKLVHLSSFKPLTASGRESAAFKKAETAYEKHGEAACVGGFIKIEILQNVETDRVVEAISIVPFFKEVGAVLDATLHPELQDEEKPSALLQSMLKGMGNLTSKGTNEVSAINRLIVGHQVGGSIYSFGSSDQHLVDMLKLFSEYDECNYFRDLVSEVSQIVANQEEE